MLRAARGAMAWGLLLLAALAADFVLDWLFQLSRPQRMLLLAACGGIGLWGFVRFVWPALRISESEIELALLVERERQIDSDLVAALQFESESAATWGSPQLETAVVDSVADFGRSLKPASDRKDVRFRRLALVFSATVLIVAALIARFPGFTRAFLDRFLLGPAHYPTRTVITRILVNSIELYSAEGGLKSKMGTGGSQSVPTVPYGHAVRFDVSTTGVRPDSGQVRIVGEQGGDAVHLALQPARPAPDKEPDSGGPAGTAAAAPDDHAGDATGPAHYAAELTRLTESVTYQIYLGDAWTEPATIQVLPLPVVSLTLDHTPPPYAAAHRVAQPASSSRQLSVIEGSQIELFVRCSNKPLAQVDLVIGSARFAFEQQDDSRQFWTLPKTGNPLSRVTEPIAFDVEAVDDDGLAPEQPLRGHIRIESDRPPRVAAAVVTDKVLPAAKPAISWGAADDFGIADLRLNRRITRASGEIDEATETIRQVAPNEQPRTSVRGRFVFDLAPLAVAKGDEIRVTLEAIDFRGPQPGVAVQSEPIVFQVTDESGVLAALAEADQKSAHQLDQIIQRQLGIGAERDAR